MRFARLLLATLAVVILFFLFQSILPSSSSPARAMHFVPTSAVLAAQPTDPMIVQSDSVTMSAEDGSPIRNLSRQETVYFIASQGNKSLVVDRYGMEGYVTSSVLGDSFKSNIRRPQEGAYYEAFSPKPQMYRNYFAVKGIYIPPKVVEDGSFDQILDDLEGSGINTLVIDYKDDSDLFLFDSEVAKEMVPSANIRRIKDPAAFMEKLKAKGLHLIARIVTFKSMRFAEEYPEKAILGSGGKPIVHDSVWWGSPADQSLWDYNVRAAKEALEYGFDEIQFDYVRFPDIKDTNVDYQMKDFKSKTEVVQSFLSYAYKELRSYNALISADVFGWTTTALDDVGIGQHWEAVSNVVDVISPMIYPSHYNRGIYGLANPNAQAYETILLSTRDAMKRNANLHTPAMVRPWIQDFSMGVPYDDQKIRDQIKALEENGIPEYLLWNAGGYYHLEATKP